MEVKSGVMRQMAYHIKEMTFIICRNMTTVYEGNDICHVPGVDGRIPFGKKSAE